MAIKDLYKNKLTKYNANIANGLVGSNSTRPNFIEGSDSPRTTATTVDGSGRPYGVERFGYNPDYQNLKNKPKTTSTTTQNNVEQNVTSSNPTWKDYADLINAKTANSKVELQTAMQRAQSASNDYLKALGLQGSGFGQSQLTDIGVQYQNALSNINANAQNSVGTQLDSDFKYMVDSGKYSPQQLQDYINQYGAQTGKTIEWESYASQSGATPEAQFKQVVSDLDSMINSGDTYTDVNGRTIKLSDEQKQYASIIQEELIEAETNEEKQKILDKYSAFLNNPMKYTNTDLSEKMKEALRKKQWDSLSEGEKNRRRLNAIKSGKYKGYNEIYLD